MMYGAPWLLQNNNTKTKRALELSTVDKTKLYHLSANFLRWWGHALHTLLKYGNSLEVNCARMASSTPKSERDKRNLRRAKQLRGDLKSGSLQYYELSESQEKLLPLALRQENFSRNPKFDTMSKTSLPCNSSMQWALALTPTGPCGEAALTTLCPTHVALPTSWAAELQTYEEGCDSRGLANEQVMPTLCFPPGLGIHSSTESPSPAPLSLRSSQELSTQPES